VLNFQPRLGGYVEGVVLEFSEAGWRALDQKEGAPNAYQRRQRHIILPDGQVLEAIAYQVIPERQQGHVAPPSAYLNAVRRGFAAHGLHPHPLEAAAMGAEGCHMLADVFVYGTLMQGGFWHAPAAEAGIAAIDDLQPPMLHAMQGRGFAAGVFLGVLERRVDRKTTKRINLQPKLQTGLLGLLCYQSLNWTHHATNGRTSQK
jgi:gamma-glutamylcyclotransferase (GGCT)/AIG2-like uncharacterized protein YtfP